MPPFFSWHSPTTAVASATATRAPAIAIMDRTDDRGARTRVLNEMQTPLLRRKTAVSRGRGPAGPACAGSVGTEVTASAQPLYTSVASDRRRHRRGCSPWTVSEHRRVRPRVLQARGGATPPCPDPRGSGSVAGALGSRHTKARQREVPAHLASRSWSYLTRTVVVRVIRWIEPFFPLSQR